ncbi:hypothetical protein KIN20_021922 [Parelaphostrongylus tenuis]|uniref:Uncharacterized protein n=1 Tax=Parelaphostrongylus tenuis TaxID=148309 RepID=A0AAD5MUT7_PARTN|nr:hypothetical protein KIN20_021922 [Parelaphostrongylus tenuis]
MTIATGIGGAVVAKCGRDKKWHDSSLNSSNVTLLRSLVTHNFYIQFVLSHPSTRNVLELLACRFSQDS